jgi:G3E family GTPase
VRAIFAGCACCTGGADLMSDIRSIRETMDPEWIIIEATGVAYPLEIKNNVEMCFSVPVKIMAMADAGRWKRLHSYMPQLIEAQVDSADCILLNKVDLVDAETAETIAGELHAYNPKAELHKVVANKPIDDSIWAFLER